MAADRVNLRTWLFRVLAWDSLLPTAVATVPFGVELVAPNCRGAMEITAVVMPIVAFLVRVRVGTGHIGSNHCGQSMRVLQLVAFCLALLPLLLFDAFLILSHVMPKGAMTAGDRVILAAALLVYVGLMVIAMYPGRQDLLPPDESADQYV